MMGHSFAELFRSFLISKSIPTSAYGIIQANPERSKHLETATLTIYGYPIDFVNLRAESYSMKSRIPVVKFGTPLEDALRRDITINALFYNIMTEEVEDFCGTGFNDLEMGIIRTPLRPKETLMDDPLRLLRVIRFATRFRFQVEPTLMLAISDIEVDGAFRSKISRERVGKELDKILRDTHAFDGIMMLNRLRVFNLVFDIPNEVLESKNCSLPLHSTIETILQLYEQTANLIKASKVSHYDLRLSLLCHCLLPHAGIMMKIPGKKPEPLVSMIVRDSLKFSNQDTCDVTRLLNLADSVRELVLNSDNVSPAQWGRMIRSLGRHWRIAFHLASVQSILIEKSNKNANLIIEAIELIQKLHLDSSWDWRPLLSGNEVKRLFNLKEGRSIGKLMTALLDWQYEHPDGSKSEALQYIRSNKESIL